MQNGRSKLRWSDGLKEIAVSFSQCILPDCRKVDAGMPHLNGLERVRCDLLDNDNNAVFSR